MRALLAVAALLLAACPSPSDRSDSVPDPRLGVVVFETNDRPFSRAPPLATVLAHDGHVVQNRGRVAVAADGSVFVLVGLDAARPFGTANDVTPSRVVVKKLSPTDALSELPAPALGSGGAPGDTAFVLAGDGAHPVIVDVPGAHNPQGRFVTVTSFDGAAWQTVNFLRGDRPPADLADVWDASNDQVRVLRPGVVVVQHGSALSRHDGSAWVPVTLPAHVKELRLGAADATRVRAYWLTTDGALASDVLRDDGTWAGTEARLKRGTAPTLKGAWGFAGDLDTFTVHYLAREGVEIARHEGGRFRLASTRPPANGEGDGTAFLVGTRHPWRTAFIDTLGQLTASYAGAETGRLGTVIGWRNGPQVTCEGEVTVGEGMVLAKDGAKCVPRTLDALDFRLDAELTTLVELFADARQDATLRLYVKRIPLPSNVVEVTKSEPATGGFPGDTGQPPQPTEQLVISGHVLVPGATNHSGTACALIDQATSRQLELVQTDVDGAVAFSPVTPGRYEAQCNRPFFSTFSTSWPAGTVGDVALDGVLVHGLLPPDDAPLPGSVAYELDGGVLLRRESAQSTVLSSAVAAGDFGRELEGQLVWQEASGDFRSTASATVFAPPRALSSFKLLGPTLVAAQGVPDGATTLTWTLADGATSLVSGGAVEVTPWASPLAPATACNGTVVWTAVAPGDVRAARGTCATPLTVDLASRSAAAVPVLRDVELASSVAFGFVGAGCGAEGHFATPCPVLGLDVLGAGPLSATQLSANALVAQQQVVNGQARVLLLEAGGALAVTSFVTPTRTEVQTGITLPTDWLPGETPLTPVDPTSQRFLVRTTAGVFVSTGEAGSWTKVTDARAVFKGGVVLRADGSLWRVLPSGAVDVLPLKGNENLRVAASGLWSDAAEMTCPDGSACRVLQRMAPDKTVTSLAAGRLTPDVLVEPRRFGLPTSRLLGARLEWPGKRVSLPP